MSKKIPDSSDYEFGYCKPPKHSQFKPGQSGNPRGRPRGRQSFQALLSGSMYRITKIRIGDEVRNVPVLEAGVLRLVQELLHGPPNKAIDIIKFVLPMIDDRDDVPWEEVLKCLSDDELDILSAINEKVEAERERLKSG